MDWYWAAALLFGLGVGLMFLGIPVAIAFFHLFDEIERFIIFEIDTHRVGICLDIRLVGRRIGAENAFFARGIYLFPIGVDVSAGIGR